MKVTVIDKKAVEAKVLKLHLKVADRFSASLVDAEGKELYDQDDGYVPDFMPGDHYGDYVILDIDVDTGQILNWDKASVAAGLDEWVNGEDGQ